MTLKIRPLFAILGTFAICLGVWFIYWKAAIILAGVFICLFSAITGIPKEPPKQDGNK